MRLVLSLAAVLAAGISIWPDIHAPALDSRLCNAGFCRFDQLFVRVDAQGMNLANLAKLIDQDPMNPLVWSAYAELLAAQGQRDDAAQIFAHAVALGPGMSPVLMRSANFDFAYGRIDHGISMAREILMQTDAFDQILFADLMHSRVPVSELLGRAIPAQPRVARAWLAWAHAHGTAQEISTTWSWMRQNMLADQHSAVDVTWALWDRKSFRSAQKTWADWLDPSQGPYLNPERLANTRFANESNGSPFDWTLAAPPSVQLSRRDGLEIRFSGTENVHFAQVHQFATVEPGRYRLSVEVSAAGLTTDEHPFFRVFDPVNPSRLEVATAQLGENAARSCLALDFRVPQGTEFVQVQIERRSSRHFDNKIAGKVHIYQVSFLRVTRETREVDAGLSPACRSSS
jgi:tetratricopeptide (TPR) repeat protein